MMRVVPECSSQGEKEALLHCDDERKMEDDKECSRRGRRYLTTNPPKVWEPIDISK
jgi:hypothetical protein